MSDLKSHFCRNPFTLENGGGEEEGFQILLGSTLVLTGLSGRPRGSQGPRPTCLYGSSTYDFLGCQVESPGRRVPWGRVVLTTFTLPRPPDSSHLFLRWVFTVPVKRTSGSPWDLVESV